MPFGSWSPWRTWNGGEPPVPKGTLVDAWLRERDEPPDEAKRYHMEFVVTTGDSFRLVNLVQPQVRTVVVERFRHWMPREPEQVVREERIEEFA